MEINMNINDTYDTYTTPMEDIPSEDIPSKDIPSKDIPSEDNLDYNQFKNVILNLIYGKLPSYAYFEESNFQTDLEDGYWHNFSDEETNKILIYFSNNYINTLLTVQTIEQEKWDAKDLLINLLLDYF